MVKPVFSEFSYGFALTHELVNRFGVLLGEAPVFPSLIDEGRLGGYDMAVPVRGWTVFLQFKVSQLMILYTAGEWAHYHHPYFRFPIRPSSYSDQHRLLLELAATDRAHFVAYVAPAFHELNDLNSHFLHSRVTENSVWVPVESIGHIWDRYQHWVTFDSATQQPLFWSEPRILSPALDGETVQELFENGPSEVQSTNLDEGFFGLLANSMVTIARGQVRPDMVDQLVARDYTPRSMCAYLARILFDSELLLVSDRHA